MDEDGHKVTLQGSMGLHQNNFQQNRSNERTIVEAFKFFRDHYVMKIRDGITSSPAKNGLTEDTIMICTANQESSSTQLDDLPYYCKLVVLSKLAALDICHLSMTSQHWRVVCSDQILWRELLFRDMVKWPNIGQRSIPLMPLSEYLQSVDVAHFVGPDLPAPAIDLHGRLCNRHGVNFKALYFHSAYQRAQDHAFIGVKHPRFQVEEEEASIPTESPMPPLAASQTFPRFLRSLWMRLRSGNGEVIMLGPGMESKNTSKIFRRLLWARPDLLMTVQLLPGGQDGVGSGVELEFKGEKRFNLIALYSGNHKDRSGRVGMERLLKSNILDPLEVDAPAEETFNPYHPVFKLHETVLNFLNRRIETYRLIYVVDATRDQSLQHVSHNRLELRALLDGVRHCEAGSATRRPLLVLCCVKDAASERISCVEIAALLDMPSITDRAWYVQDITVNNLSGLEDALVWLFKQT